ncbi:hypothetical protein A0H81_00290 [Grifola frondosa]|uniref:Uncharacterized protein n=1 Tax=Grifola frondosa TaxID=5627 RepID=A0A1C7MSL5_GRIFR|nr:hypothetical protein A0H81_00290 [Grifola frondosa]
MNAVGRRIFFCGGSDCIKYLHACQNMRGLLPIPIRQPSRGVVLIFPALWFFVHAPQGWFGRRIIVKQRSKTIIADSPRYFIAASVTRYEQVLSSRSGPARTVRMTRRALIIGSYINYAIVEVQIGMRYNRLTVIGPPPAMM